MPDTTPPKSTTPTTKDTPKPTTAKGYDPKGHLAHIEEWLSSVNSGMLGVHYVPFADTDEDDDDDE